MPRPKGPLPSPLDAVQKMLQTGTVGGRAGAPEEEIPPRLNLPTKAPGDQSPNPLGDQSPNPLIPQDTRILGDQATNPLGYQDTRRLIPQDTRILRDQAPGSRNAKSSSAEYQKLGVYIRTGTYTRLRVHAALAGREISDIADQALLEYLARNE